MLKDISRKRRRPTGLLLNPTNFFLSSDCYHVAVRKGKVPPAGFIALRYNDGEPIRRYHFALADRMNTPEIDTYVDVCIPGDVRINKIRCNLYVSGHYGIRQYGRSP